MLAFCASGEHPEIVMVVVLLIAQFDKVMVTYSVMHTFFVLLLLDERLQQRIEVPLKVVYNNRFPEIEAHFKRLEETRVILLYHLNVVLSVVVFEPM